MTIRYAHCPKCQATTAIYWTNVDWRCQTCRTRLTPSTITVAFKDRDSQLPADARVVKVSAAPRNKEQCSGACLAGRITCDCQCRGRCHGASRCAC